MAQKMSKGRVTYRPSTSQRQAPSCTPFFILSWSFIGLWAFLLAYMWYCGMVDERMLRQNVDVMVSEVGDVVAETERHAIRGAQIVEREFIKDTGYLETELIKDAGIVERELLKDAALVESEIVREARLLNGLEKRMLRGIHIF
jgi:hypothetical protein